VAFCADARNATGRHAPDHRQDKAIVVIEAAPKFSTLLF
jgi:hypothetical protein